MRLVHKSVMTSGINKRMFRPNGSPTVLCLDGRTQVGLQFACLLHGAVPAFAWKSTQPNPLRSASPRCCQNPAAAAQDPPRPVAPIPPSPSGSDWDGRVLTAGFPPHTDGGSSKRSITHITPKVKTGK